MATQSISSSVRSFRSIGAISCKAPLHVYKCGVEIFVATSVRNAFYIYDAQSLNLTFTATYDKPNINFKQVLFFSGFLFCLSSHYICVFDRNRLIKAIFSQEENLQLAFFEDCLFLLQKGMVKSWNERFNRFDFKFFVDPIYDYFVYFSNKNILLISSKSKRILFYTFAETHNSSSIELDETPINVSIFNSGIIPLTLSDGSLTLVKNSKSILTISNYQGNFFSTAVASESFLITGDHKGFITLWDLTKSEELHRIEGHVGKVISILFIDNGKVFITNSDDNTIKIWTIEHNQVKLLKFREGHLSPIKAIHFIGKNFENLISFGLDGQIRQFNLCKDSRSFEFSQGSLAKYGRKYNLNAQEMRLPPVIDYDVFDTKTVKWSNLASCHSGMNCVYLWKLESKSISNMQIFSADQSEIKNVLFSPCGKFISSITCSNAIQINNIQSGKLIFKSSETIKQKIIGAAYNITGSVLTCFLIDNSVILFNTINRKVKKTKLLLDSSVKNISRNKGTNFVFMFHQDFSISLYDMETCNIIRRFYQHKNHITDACIYPNLKRFISASLDQTLCIWDIESGCCLEKLSFQHAPISIAVSLDLMFLAVAFSSNNDISIFSLSHYSCLSKPTSTGFSLIDKSSGIKHFIPSISLAGLEKYKWLSIVNYETITDNNKPVLINNIQAKIPFFIDQAVPEVTDNFKTKFSMMSVTTNNDVEFTNVNDLKSFLLSAEWPKIHLFIMSIQPEELKFILPLLVSALLNMIDEGYKFDFSTLIIKCIIKVHKESLSNFCDLQSIIALRAAVIKKWSNIQNKLDYSLCVLSNSKYLSRYILY